MIWDYRGSTEHVTKFWDSMAAGLSTFRTACSRTMASGFRRSHGWEGESITDRREAGDKAESTPPASLFACPA